MLSELQKGDDVATTGGLIGRITGIKDDVVTLQVQEGVRLRVLRSAVTGRHKFNETPKSGRQGLLAQQGSFHGTIMVVEGPPLWMCIVLAGLYLVPTVVPEEKRPAFFKDHFTKTHPAWSGLAGGLHLVYEVNIDKAVSSKVDRLSNDIEDAIKKKSPDVTVGREGRDDITVSFKNPQAWPAWTQNCSSLRRELERGQP